MANLEVKTRETSWGVVHPLVDQDGGVSGQGKAVLRLSDMTWLGSFLSPAEVYGQGGTDSVQMTCRRDGSGNLLIGWLTPWVGGYYIKGNLIESAYPGVSQTAGSAPIATTLYSYTNGWQSQMNWVNKTGPFERNGGPVTIYKQYLHWDAAQGCYFLTYTDSYNTNPATYNDPTLIRVDINDNTHVATATGPFHVGGQIPHHVGGYMVSIPSWWTSNVGGKSLAIGKGFSSGGASSSHGDALWAFTPPTGSTPVWPDSTFGGQSTTQLIGGDITHRQKRPGDVVGSPLCAPSEPSVNQPTPTEYSSTSLTADWGSLDNSEEGAAVWVDTATKTGVIFVVNHGRGHVWYMTTNPNVPCAHNVMPEDTNQGPVAMVNTADAPAVYGSGDSVQTAFRLYDPNEFLGVINSTTEKHQVPLTEWAYLNTAFSSWHRPSGNYTSGFRVHGACFDPVDNLLMVCNRHFDGFGNWWRVNVWQVS